MLELREAEERRRVGAERPFHRAETLLDLVLGLCSVIFLPFRLTCDQVCVPTVWPCGQHLAQDLRMIGGVLADREEQALGAFVGERLQHRGRVVRPRDRRRRSARPPCRLRKSNCLKCSKPKPGPPVVSISTTRETPSAFGLAQVDFCWTGATGGRGRRGEQPRACPRSPPWSRRHPWRQASPVPAADRRHGRLLSWGRLRRRARK